MSLFVRPLVHVARRLDMKGSKVIHIYSACVVTATLLVLIYHALRATA